MDDPVRPRRVCGFGSPPIHVLVAVLRPRSRRPRAANWAVGHGASASACGSDASLPPARKGELRTWAAEDRVSSRELVTVQESGDKSEKTLRERFRILPKSKAA